MKLGRYRYLVIWIDTDIFPISSLATSVCELWMNPKWLLRKHIWKYRLQMKTILFIPGFLIVMVFCCRNDQDMERRIDYGYILVISRFAKYSAMMKFRGSPFLSIYQAKILRFLYYQIYNPCFKIHVLCIADIRTGDMRVSFKKKHKRIVFFQNTIFVTKSSMK